MVASSQNVGAVISRDRDGGEWDAEADVIVIGSGVAGFSTAIHAADLGASVVMLEKAGELGGTSRKAAAWMWVPNNRFMRDLGREDTKDSFVALLARLGRPLLFDPTHPLKGLTRWEHDLIEAYFDNAATSLERFEALDVLKTMHSPEMATYNDVAGDENVTGRVVVPAFPNGDEADGAYFIDRCEEAATKMGIEIRRSCRVQAVVVSDQDRVVGVRAASDSGAVDIRARKGVAFASGGFTHNEEMRREYLGGMYVGGCAAVSNEGDFIPIAKSLGVPLIHMHAAFGSPVSYEHALAKDPTISGVFSTPGDSLVVVNKYGDRVGNEKTTYNDRNQAHFTWDPARAEYPNFLLFPVWDQRATDLFAGLEDGNFIPPADADWSAVVRGDTFAELGAALDERLSKLSEQTRGLRLDASFAANLDATVARFNGFARTGIDTDFHRGESTIEKAVYSEVAADNDLPNGTMFPLSDSGPYYASILGPGSIETKGGPKTDRDGRVLDHAERPVKGLYGVGNCVASPSGQAYWAGGATFGPYMAAGYSAAQSLVREAGDSASS